MMIRQPIVVVLGHVDHGKTMLLDRIRSTAVLDRETGGITQSIGASEVPASYLKEHCGDILKRLKVEITIPGLLFIDSPGHKAFTSLRQRGGSIADLAILVVDVTQGFQPQTIESLKILKHYKTPFIVAANKIDLLPGWKATATGCFIDAVREQDESTAYELDKRIYTIAGRLSHEGGHDSDRYDRVSDFTKQVAIIPTSAKTGQGISDLLALLAGLAQRFLANKLEIEEGRGARGTVLEVKQEKGIGTVIDVIIYDGTLKVGDTIAIAGIDGPIETKVRGLLRPKPLDEMRQPREKFSRMDAVCAAAGVRIVAPGLEGSIAGSPLLTGKEGKESIQKEVDSVLKGTTSELGLVVKANALGSLEAISSMLKEENIPAKALGIGPITRKDIIEAADSGRKDEFLGVVMGFDVPAPGVELETLAKERGARIIRSDVIYQLVEQYKEFVKERTEQKKKEELDKLVRAAIFKVLPGYVFRQSHPAVVGIEVQEGTLKAGVGLINSDGDTIGVLKQLQEDNETVTSAGKGTRCAASIDGPVVGRQLREGDTLYTLIPEAHYFKLRELEKLLTDDEKGALSQIAAIMRKKNKPSWGMTWNK